MVVSDLQHACRLLVRQPGFTVIVVLTLALGFGANIAIFSGANAWLFKPLPVPTRDRLVSLRYQGGGGDFPYHVYQALREHATAFDHLAAYASMPMTLRDEHGMDRVMGQLVSGNYFEALGITAARGRALVPADDQPGVAGSVVLSDRFWKQRFDADPSVIGRAIRVNGLPCTVVGITRPPFFGLRVGESPDLWLPLQLEAQFFPNRSALQTRTTWWLNVAGTVRRGVSRDAATAAAMRALQTEQPDERVFLEPTEHYPRSGLLPTPVVVLQCLALSILLICCVNVTSLLLARSTARQRELALRATLGAGRVRLVRQMLAESGVLVATGCLLGLAVAAPLANAAIRFLPGRRPTVLDVAPDYRVLLFALLLALIATVGVSLAPALRAACTDVLPFLKSTPPSHLRPRGGIRGFRWLLVPAQIALSVLLLVMAGLFVRSLQHLRGLGAHVEPDRVLVADVSPRDAGYTGERLLQFYTDLRSRLAGLPGVINVGLGALSPLGGAIEIGGPLAIEGSAPLDPQIRVHGNRVTPGYFEATGMPVVAGRDFVDADRDGAPLVVTVNQAFVRRFCPTTNPLGRRVRYGNGPPLEIIGVVRDFRFVSLHDEPRPALFYPVAQQPLDRRLTVHLRTIGDAGTLTRSLREQVRALDANVGLTDIRTLAIQFDRGLGEERLVTTVASIFGALALLLAAVGLYGLISYAVARRTAEMGIRAALGATPASIRGLVLRETLVVVALGLGLGVPLAWAGARFARSLLTGIEAGDGTVFITAMIAILGTAVLAAWLPARRAARVDPVVALRAE